MTNNLFEQHLFSTKHRGLQPLQESEQVTESDAALITDAITAFANSLETVEDFVDLEESWTNWCAYHELSDQTINVLQDTLIEATEQTFGEASDASIKSFLRQLQKPFAAATTTTHNKEGMTPEAGETSTKAFLKKLTVAVHPDPYQNDYLGGVKAYDREANRHGYNYSYKNDFNNHRPTWPLANPDLNVNSGATDQKESRVFKAVDSVGLGSLVHWRVYNTLTGEYVTQQIHKEDAQQVAAELNAEFAQQIELQESGPTRKHFQQVANTVRAIEDPKKRQEFADHHAALFAAQNPRFDHARFHAACGTKHKGKVQNEAIASTPIQEGLLHRDDAKMNRYLAAMKRQNFTASGDVAQSNHPSTAASDWRAAQALINEQRRKEDAVTESNAVPSKQNRNVRRTNEVMNDFSDSQDDKQNFLDGINNRGLIGK
jgi:hypothetical protein